MQDNEKIKIIDVCSRPCPQPVMEVKKAMQENPSLVLRVILNDEAARENIERFSRSRNYRVEAKGIGEEKTELLLTPPSAEEEPLVNEETGDRSRTVFFLRTYGIGSPDEDLGVLLVKTFFQTLPNISPLPDKIVFMHGAVKHTVEGAECLHLLKNIESMGTEIVICGTCLDYYELKDKVGVGRVSNFFEIASILNSAGNTVTL